MDVSKTDPITPPPSPTFRRARQTDLREIASLQIESWRAAYRGLLPEADLGAPVAQDLNARWQPNRLETLQVTVAERSGLVGFASIEMRDGAGFLDNLHVRPDLHGTGLGRSLMGHAAGDVLRAGARAMWLTVITDNIQARGFYARMGGEEGAMTQTLLYGQPVEIVPVHWADVTTLAQMT